MPDSVWKCRKNKEIYIFCKLFAFVYRVYLSYPRLKQRNLQKKAFQSNTEAKGASIPLIRLFWLQIFIKNLCKIFDLYFENLDFWNLKAFFIKNMFEKSFVFLFSNVFLKNIFDFCLYFANIKPFFIKNLWKIFIFEIWKLVFI